MSKTELFKRIHEVRAKDTKAMNIDAMYEPTEYKRRLGEFLDAEFDANYIDHLCSVVTQMSIDAVTFYNEATQELMSLDENRKVLEMDEINRKKYMHSDAFKSDIPDGAKRGILHNYFRVRDRKDILGYFVSTEWNKKKLRFRVKGMMRDIARAVIESPKDSVVANALLDRLAKYTPAKVEGVVVESTTRDNMVMTVLQLFKDIGAVKIEVVQDKRTKAYSHMVSVPFKEEHMTVSLYESYRAVNGRRALLSSPAGVESTDKLMSTGSWYYKSPELSEDVINFLNIQNQTKLNIIDDDTLLEKAIIRKYYDEDDAKFMVLEHMLPWQRERAIKFYEELDDIRQHGGFFVKHFIDSKYRTYEQSELFGVQQNSAARALVEFANRRALNEAGTESMKLDIACKAGYDKATKEEALEGFAIHEKTWREDPKLKREFSVLDGEDTGFIVYQDATNSGTQMYAVATGSKRLAQISGLLKGTRYDAYSMLAEELNKALEVECFNRKNVKSIFMTKLYNAGKELILNGAVKNVEDMNALEQMEMNFGIKKTKLTPLQVTLGKNGYSYEDNYVYARFEVAMGKLAPIALLMMEAIGEIDDRELYSWEMPDGAQCMSARYGVVEEDVLWSNETGNRHHFVHKRKVANKAEKKAALAPGIIHSMDSYALRETVRRCFVEGIDTVTIHDSIGSHPNDAQRVREIYKEVLADMFEMDIMSNILGQLMDREFNVRAVVDKDDLLTVNNILESEYGLWA